jgi:hypothetical protein
MHVSVTRVLISLLLPAKHASLMSTPKLQLITTASQDSDYDVFPQINIVIFF